MKSQVYNASLGIGTALVAAGAGMLAGAAVALITTGILIIGLTLFTSFFGGVR